jgi:ketosteroid isomerase-like protein
VNKTYRTVFLALALGVSMAAILWQSRATVAASPASDASVLTKADQAFDAATAARGQEGFASFIADDMTTVRENQDVVRGKAQFVDGWKGLFTTPGLSVRWQPQLGRISDDRTMGFTVGTYQTLRKQEGEGSARMVGSGKYVTIWRKQPDGSWKVVFDSGVKDTPPASATPRKE